MPRVELLVSSPVVRTPRLRIVEGAFDCPLEQKTSREWSGDVPLDAQPWSVGLIVGPSGSGKSSVARSLFGSLVRERHEWPSDRAIIDAVAPDVSARQVIETFQSIGLNTIPSWARPYAVLSNGERFRADIARSLLEDGDLVVIDEFTSVVDRQIGKIVAHTVQKNVRRHPSRQFVAVTCHEDVVDWLQPDWVLRPETMRFDWRSVQRRPVINARIGRVPWETWRLFAPHHYMSASLHRAARCHAMFVGNEPVAFSASLKKPHKPKQIVAVSRTVTLPDWQGLGIVFALQAELGRAWSALGYSYRNYPAHAAFVKAHRPSEWRMLKPLGSPSSPRRADGYDRANTKRVLGRSTATLEWIGGVMPVTEARALVDGTPFPV